MAATAQAQAEATKEAQSAGIKAARLAEDSAVKYGGRKPTFDVEQLHRTTERLSMGWTPSAIAVEIGIPPETVYSATVAAACFGGNWARDTNTLPPAGER